MKCPKCTLPEERHEEILGLFNSSLSEEEEEQMRQLFPKYLFFRNEWRFDGYDGCPELVRLCTCTSCRDTFEAVRGNYTRGKLHNEPCNCPNCGNRVTAKAVGKYRYDMTSLEAKKRTVVARPTGDGGMLLQAGTALMTYNHDNLEGDISWQVNKLYYLSMNGIQEWSRTDIGTSIGWGSRPPLHMIRWSSWYAQKSIGEPFAPNNMGYALYDGSYSVIGLKEAVEGSDLRYCRIREFYDIYTGTEPGIYEGAAARYIVRYLAQYTRHPQLEMAVPLKIEKAVEELLRHGDENTGCLNWKAKTPAAFMKLSKEDAKAYIRGPMDFEDLREWKKADHPLSLGKAAEYSDKLSVNGDGWRNLKKTAKCAETAGVSLERAVRYILRQTPNFLDGAGQTSAVEYWSDYLDMAAHLRYDMKDEAVTLPKKLKERHDKAQELMDLEKEQIELQKYAGRRRELEKRFAFIWGDYCIKIPTGPGEIVREGRTLHHCVGGYARRHVEGTTTILFMRHRKKPGRPFLTIEVSGENTIRIIQIHGYRNESYRPKETPKVRYGWWLEVWLAWVNQGSRRDRNGQPIIPAAYTEGNGKETKTA